MGYEMTKMEQNLCLAAVYLEMNDEGRDLLDMALQKLSGINEGPHGAKCKDGFTEEIEEKE